MKVKTYKNESLQEGLEDIKRDLGSDALILSTRSISERPRFGLFKKQAWEITAALEEERGQKPVATQTQEKAGEGDRRGEKGSDPRLKRDISFREPLLSREGSDPL